MAYIYPLNNPGGVHLTVFDFTHLSPPPIVECIASNDNRPSDDHMAQRAEVALVTWVDGGVARHCRWYS